MIERLRVQILAMDSRWILFTFCSKIVAVCKDPKSVIRIYDNCSIFNILRTINWSTWLNKHVYANFKTWYSTIYWSRRRLTWSTTSKLYGNPAQSENASSFKAKKATGTVSWKMKFNRMKLVQNVATHWPISVTIVSWNVFRWQIQSSAIYLLSTAFKTVLKREN